MLKEKVATLLGPHLSLSEEEIVKILEFPPSPDMGDVAFPCFTLAKSLKRSPNQIAAELAESIQSSEAQITATGPYLNFKLNRTVTAAQILAPFYNEQIVITDIGQGQRVVIDMSSPNIAKPFAIGHLRSTMIGNALYRILERVGYNTVSVNHLGDWGTQFGKQIVAYLKWGDEQKIAADPIKAYLELYVKFHNEAEEHPELEDEARAWFQKLESGEEQATELWNTFINESLKSFNALYDRLGVHFDHVLGESFYNDKMESVVQELQAKGLLEESDGALVVRLDEHQLPPCIIVKSDGASIYATRDLATAIYRHNQLKADRLLYVVGAEQSLHFRQLFLVLNKMGCSWSDACAHVPFGLMKIGGRKMSTRKGKVVFLEKVLNEAVERALLKIEEKNPGLSNKREVAEAIGIGAVVFADLKNTRTLEIDFDLEEIVSFDGETGPYVQYTYARTNSLLAKGMEKGIAATLEHSTFLAGDASWQLITLINQYPQAVVLAAERLEPSVLSKYLLDLAQSFNRFYHHERVLTENLEESAAKLALVAVTSILLKEGLTLLGIQAPKEI